MFTTCAVKVALVLLNGTEYPLERSVMDSVGTSMLLSVLSQNISHSYKIKLFSLQMKSLVVNYINNGGL